MTIEIIEVQSPVITEFKVQLPKAQGWTGFCTSDLNSPQMWLQLTPTYDPITRDVYRCPYPLFLTRESIIAAAEKNLVNGGVLKLFKIEL